MGGRGRQGDQGQGCSEDWHAKGEENAEAQRQAEFRRIPGTRPGKLSSWRGNGRGSSSSSSSSSSSDDPGCPCLDEKLDRFDKLDRLDRQTYGGCKRTGGIPYFRPALCFAASCAWAESILRPKGKVVCLGPADGPRYSPPTKALSQAACPVPLRQQGNRGAARSAQQQRRRHRQGHCAPQIRGVPDL